MGQENSHLCYTLLMMSYDSTCHNSLVCVFSSCSHTKLKPKRLGHSAWPQLIPGQALNMDCCSRLLYSDQEAKGHGPMQAQPLSQSSNLSIGYTVASSLNITR